MGTRFENKVLALEEQLKADFGKNAVMRAKDIPKYDIVSTGSLALDFAVGLGGIPSNRVVELVGPEAVGKTTLALHIMNNFLNRYPERIGIYIDLENRLSADWVANFIEDMDRLHIVKPDSMEQATNAYVMACKTGLVSCVVVDSIGGAPTEAALERDAMKADFGGNAKAVSAFARFTQVMSKYNVCTIGINQIRDDFSGYNQLITPGGHAWKHACSLRIRLKKGKGKVTDTVDGEDIPVGNTIVASIIKSSVGVPFKVATYWFYNVKSRYGFGIDTAEEILTLSILTGVVQRNAAMHLHPSLPGGKIRGKDAFKEFVLENEDVRKQITAETMAVLAEGDTKILSSIGDENDDAEDTVGEVHRNLSEEKEDI